MLSLSFLTIVWLFGYDILNSFLSPEKPVENANILIIEGWMNPGELKTAVNLFHEGQYKQLIIAGSPHTNPFLMGKNGRLVFDLQDSISGEDIPEIQIYLSGSLEQPHESTFSVFTDSHKIGNGTVGKNFKWSTFPIDSENRFSRITIRFTNDDIVEGKDRNLLVEGVRVGKKYYSAYHNSTFYHVESGNDSSIIRLADNSAEMAKFRLLALGIPEKCIISVSGEPKNGSRTLSAAAAVADTFCALSPPLKNANILSRSPHGRRTWYAFHKCLPEYEIGILTLPVSEETGKIKRRTLYREIIGLLYTRLTPCPGK